MSTHEASSRILVDRSVLRLDGRPFFAFGPRVLLTPPERYRTVLADIVSAGFNIVATPPCSPGNLPLVESFFDAAEEAGLLVVLLADPRLPDHGRYLAERFRHRHGLHSYLLPARPADRQSLSGFLRERDALRTRDLFHPIHMPLGREHLDESWLQSQDLFSVSASVTERRLAGALPRIDPARTFERVAAGSGSHARPRYCVDLPVIAREEERALGLYSEDPAVARHSPRPMDWYPHLANFATMSRRDLLAPDPEALRLWTYGLLAAEVRGILLDFHEGFCGQLPFTGRDRLAEAAILAAEIRAFEPFFSEGRPDYTTELDTGHPRLRGTILRHGHEQLLLFHLGGYEDDFFIDEAHLERTEITVRPEDMDAEPHAWRMDFPHPCKLEVHRDQAGTLRFLAGPLELTGLVLLTPGTHRCQRICDQLRELLPGVARHAANQLEVRFAKVLHTESELRTMGAGVNNMERLRHMQKALEQSRTALTEKDWGEAYRLARHGSRLGRQIVKYQMARALATPVFENNSLRALLRMSYFTLPRFYREGAFESARAFTELT